MAKSTKSAQAAMELVDASVGFGRSSDNTFKLPSAGTIKEYRRMGTGPTIALAKAITASAIRSCPWSFEIEKGATDEQLRITSDVIMPLRSELLRQAMYSLGYGFQTIYTPWALNSDGLLAPECLVPILPEDIKEIEVDARCRNPISFSTKDVKYDASEIVHFVYDSEGKNPFGRSRHENIREFGWEPWKQSIRKFGNYTTKHSSCIPIVEYQPGESPVRGGGKQNNSEIADQMLELIPIGKGVKIPRVLMPSAEKLIQQGAKVSEVMAWSIRFLECASGAGEEILGGLKHFESLQMRGWFAPERTALEGTTGTRADAGSHGDIMAENAQTDAGNIVAAIQTQLVNPFVVKNFGQSMVGTIKLKAAPINEARKALIGDLVKTILTDPNNRDVLERAGDLDGWMDELELSKKKTVVNVAAEDDVAEPSPTPKQLSRRAMGYAKFMASIANDCQ